MGRNGVSVRFRLFCLGPAWETDTGDRFRPLKAEFDALDKGLEPSVDYERNQANEHIHAIDAYRLIGKSVRRWLMARTLKACQGCESRPTSDGGMGRRTCPARFDVGP